MGGDTDHEPPVENPRLLDPEEGLDGPGEAVLVPQLGHQRARHLVSTFECPVLTAIASPTSSLNLSKYCFTMYSIPTPK